MSVGHLWWELLWKLWYLGFPHLHHIANNHTRKPLFHQSQRWKIKLIWTTMRRLACTIFALTWCECLNSHWNAKEINGQSKTNQINLENSYTHVNQMFAKIKCYSPLINMIFIVICSLKRPLRAATRIRLWRGNPPRYFITIL